MSEPSEHGAVSRLAAMLEGRTLRLCLALAILSGIGIGLTFAWRKWGEPVVHGPRYAITADDIEATPLPDWIRGDMAGEVLRSGSLEGASLLDPQLTIKVADAFRLHPWVREVQRVTKQYPAKVQVAVEYRRPAALVEVSVGDARGVLPVDGDAVLLPRDDFVDDAGQLLPRALAYPVIVAGDSIPQGQAGSPWGDRRVYEAARIAAAFGDDWATCGLFKILLPSPSHEESPEQAEYMLLARNGSRILWGRSAGKSEEEQAAAREKVERLVKLASDNGALQAGAAPVEIDLRDPADVRLGPATAQRP
ncbi:MAG: hypothetical protein KY475_26840 [Planctomycetes bacterium]|nr:hypothetical protein [Planctomycetota bacterium]